MSSVIFSYLSTVLCSSTTDFVCVGRNLWPPKLIKIMICNNWEINFHFVSVCLTSSS